MSLNVVCCHMFLYQKGVNNPGEMNFFSKYKNNRGGGIRTHDPSVPNAVRYQAALRPEFLVNYSDKPFPSKVFNSSNIDEGALGWVL